jgi:Mannosyltransferase (PIG-V)
VSQPATSTHARALPSAVVPRRGWLSWARRSEANPALAFTVKTVVASRLVVWGAAILAIALIGANKFRYQDLDTGHYTFPFASSALNLAFAPAARWDSVWYLHIAASGYFSRSATAFFPLYPLLIHLGTVLVGSGILAGTLISLVSMTVGLYLLHRLVGLDLSDAQARATVLLVAFFPVSFFLSAVYTEALFLMLSVGAIYAARLDRWAWAGVLGALAAATHSNGLFVALPLAMIYLYGPRAGGRARQQAHFWQPRYGVSGSILWLGVVPVGLLAYMGYLVLTHHSPMAPFTAEAGWGRQFAGPFGAVPRALADLPAEVRFLLSGAASVLGPGHGVGWTTTRNLLDMGFLAFAAAGLALSWRRVPFAYFVYAVALLAEALSYPNATEPLLSFSRFVIPMFPVFMGWGALIGERPTIRRDVLTVSAALLVMFSALWALWAWIA